MKAMKKILAVVLAMALVITGMYLVPKEADEVQATETTSTESTSTEGVSTCFVAIPKSAVIITPGAEGESTVKTVDAEASEGAYAVYADYIFAGWFTDDTCTNDKVATESTENAYAKFVPADILTVKAQIATTTVQVNDVDSYVMRFISSVDSLDYSNVGFKVTYEDSQKNTGSKEPYYATEVFERIESTTNTVKYEFSPKVVDTKSEYFVTAKMVAENDKTYTVTPFWTTFDGTVVYGSSRCLGLVDGSSTTTVNVSFETTDTSIVKGSTISDVSYGTTTGKTAEVIGVTGNTVHARVNVDDSEALPSVTKFTLGTAGTAYHRNLYTEYSPSSTAYDATKADETWYTEYSGTESEFVIASVADLYGLPNVVNTRGETFANKKIYVVSDIKANNGTAGTNGWTAATENGTGYYWSPIGNSDKKFQGTFDGCGHEIEGIYTNGAIAYCGLFGYTKDAKIYNLSLTNSILKTSTSADLGITAVYAGSIVAYGEAKLNNIYSNANVSSDYLQMAGLIGTITDGSKSATECDIINCSYEGTLYSRYTVSSKNLRYGGLVGYVVHGMVTIENSFFGGKITFNEETGGGNYIGGLVADSNGTSNSEIHISNSISAGTITLVADKSFLYVGSVAGRANNGAITIKDVYATQECYDLVDATNSNSYFGSTGDDTATQLSEESLVGMSAYHVTNLDFVNDWALMDSSLPIPMTLAEEHHEVTKDIKANTNWYTGNDTSYEISTPEQLLGLSILVNSGTTFEGIEIKLTADIDLNEGWDATLTVEEGSISAPEEAVNEWIPIGTANNPFKGVFNGNNKTISGLYIDKRVDAGFNAGLFGYTTGATIQNLGLIDGYIYVNGVRTNCTTGALVGQGTATVNSVYSNVGIYGVNSINIGGMIGKTLNASSLTECWYDGTIVLRVGDAYDMHVAGIIGYAMKGATPLTNVLFTGEMDYRNIKTYSEATTADTRIGGFFGRDNGTAAVITLSNSLSAGTITVHENETCEFINTASIIGYSNGTTGITKNASDETTVYTTEAVLGRILNRSTPPVDVGTDIEIVTEWSGIKNLDSAYWAQSVEGTPVLKNLVQNYQPSGWELP